LPHVTCLDRGNDPPATGYGLGSSSLSGSLLPLPTFWRPFAASTMWPSPERDKERRCSLIGSTYDCPA